MAELFDRICTWLDPRFVGEIAAACSGRVLAALAIFGLGVSAEQRALPAATLASSK